MQRAGVFRRLFHFAKSTNHGRGVIPGEVVEGAVEGIVLGALSGVVAPPLVVCAASALQGVAGV